MRIFYWFSFNLRIWSTIVKMQSSWARAHYVRTQPIGIPALNQWYMWVVFLCALLRLIFTFGYIAYVNPWNHTRSKRSQLVRFYCQLKSALQVIFQFKFFNMSCVSISKICEMNNFHSTGIKYVMAQFTKNTRNRNNTEIFSTKRERKNQWEMVSTQSF